MYNKVRNLTDKKTAPKECPSARSDEGASLARRKQAAQKMLLHFYKVISGQVLKKVKAESPGVSMLNIKEKMLNILFISHYFSKSFLMSFSIGYVPMFPNIMGESLGEVKNEFYSDILTEITKTFYNKCIFVRFDMDLRVIVDNKDRKASDGNEEPLGAIITMFYKDEATYLYGASSNEHRNLMSTYLLQWQAIKDAKEYGCKVYDFYGIPPTDEPSYPMVGLYRFKTGFGGKIVHRIGSIDVFRSKILYKLYSWLEKLRSVYYKK